MSQKQREKLREILTAANMLRLFPNDAEITRLGARLEDFFSAYAGARAMFGFGETLPPHVGFDQFLAEHEANPERVRALLQALAFLCSPPILAAMWMVMSGASIRRLSYEYIQEQSSRLMLVLGSSGNEEVPFVSTNHWDTAILRFAAISTVNNEPLIESFYPLHIPQAKN